MGLFSLFSRTKRDQHKQLTAEAEALHLQLKQYRQTVSDQMYQYVYPYDISLSIPTYAETTEKIKAETSHKHLLKSNAYCRLLSAKEQLEREKSQLNDTVATHNKAVLDTLVPAAYSIIGNVEGQKLDRQQMESIVKTPHSSLIIASAGSGKTTTILGKVKFLLATKQVTPSDLLVLSFTRASSEEMKARLKKETDENIYVATFHKLGRDIVKRANSKVPNIFDDSSYSSFIKSRVKEYMSAAAFQGLVIDHLINHQVSEKSEFEFQSKAEYADYLKTNPPTTLKGERVKSYGEMEIANFFAQHKIRYEYEHDYPVDTANSEYGQYSPDFYLPDYDLYLEYFGIDRNGHVPSWFTSAHGKTPSEEYNAGIRWKRELHKKKDTTLVEAYAYEHHEGTLLSMLQSRLERYGVDFSKTISLPEYLEESNQKESEIIASIVSTCSTVILLAKGKRMNAETLIHFCSEKNPREISLAKIVAPIYRDYEAELQRQNKIDFTDMLLQAADLCNSGKFVNQFKYVIVDEYQDISMPQYELLSAMRKQLDYTLFCVGDDWQSIYRFAGSDIDYILHFSDYWDKCDISYIETTYRFPQKLIDVAGEFIMGNPNQLKKKVRSGVSVPSNDSVIENIQVKNRFEAPRALASEVEKLPANSSVFLIGRYNFDIDDYIKGSVFNARYDNVKGITRITLYSRPDLTIYYYTAHRSKGLQADYVFILNNRADRMGFPSKIQNPPLIEMLLQNSDGYPDAEERRLYYVAMTRAKKKVYFLTEYGNLSSFADKLQKKYFPEVRRNFRTCPLCGGLLILRTGKYGQFYGCSNYAKTGCKYKERISQGNTHANITNTRYRNYY